jgi:endo-1,4-beta-D-glucanase Y
MQKNYFFSLSFSLLLALALPSYAVLEIPNTQPKVGAEVWKPILDKTWEGIKKRNIEPFSTAQGLIHRPKSETPGDAVSEGVCYGMLLALYSNDQETFNTIWEAGNNNLWQGCYYDWRISASGTKDRGAATDAEEDVALALIFANKLVEKGLWIPILLLN